MKGRKAVVLFVCFWAAFFAIGLPYWQVPYAKLALPNTLYGYGLCAVFVLAALLRIVGKPNFLATVASIGFAAPAAVMARIIHDTSVDSTSHNLWPFEVVIAGIVGVSVALAGALIGNLVAFVIGRVTGGRSGT